MTHNNSQSAWKTAAQLVGTAVVLAIIYQLAAYAVGLVFSSLVYALFIVGKVAFSGTSFFYDGLNFAADSTVVVRMLQIVIPLMVMAGIFVLTSSIQSRLHGNKVLRVATYAALCIVSALFVFYVLLPAASSIDRLGWRLDATLGDAKGLSDSHIYQGIIFFMAVACWMSYAIFTAAIEVFNRTRRVVRHIAVWFVTVVASVYASLLVLHVHYELTAPHFTALCAGQGRTTTAGQQCVEWIDRWQGWLTITPALITFMVVVLVTVGYFWWQQRSASPDGEEK